MLEPQNDTVTSNGEITPAQTPAPANQGAYVAPVIFPIGASGELLQGSGRHKNDDTGRRGFEVG